MATASSWPPTEEREGGGFVVRDPWGIAVLFVPAQSLEHEEGPI
jgi:hypothetical protein